MELLLGKETVFLKLKVGTGNQDTFRYIEIDYPVKTEEAE